jgi:uncharacterized protein
MRLKKSEIESIKTAVSKRDNASSVILFGSRVDDNKKGGDIDLLVLSQTLTFRDKLDILSELHEKIGEQKIDLIIRKNTEDPFTRIIQNNGVVL